MNDFSTLGPAMPAIPHQEHWIDGNTETVHPLIASLDQYPDDQRVMHTHTIHQDENALVERKKLNATPDYRGPTDHLVFTTHDRPDRVHLHQADHLVLDINDWRYHITTSSATQVIVLNTQGGHDDIRVDDDVQATIFIDSGSGDDRLLCGGGFTKIDAGPGDDRIFTRSGASYIEAGDGNDVVSAHGSGPMTAYGGKGHDTLSGGEGACFIDGGLGDDVLVGGRGHNVLSGADGDDQITPGPGRNTIYTGTGVDFITHLRPDVQLFNAYSASEPVPSTLADDSGVIIAAKGLDSCGIVVEGTPRFQERVNDDLRLLLGSGNGRQLLDVLGEVARRSGKPVLIRELTEEENGMCFPGRTPQDDPFIRNGEAGIPTLGCTVYYDPSFLKGEVTSVVHLYHELCHAYNFVTGTTFPGWSPDGVDANKPRDAVPNAELQAVGLTVEASAFDFDKDPATAPLTSNPEPFTENGLRKEFGIPPRRQYRES